jgi:hypothetical protein
MVAVLEALEVPDRPDLFVCGCPRPAHEYRPDGAGGCTLCRELARSGRVLPAERATCAGAEWDRGLYGGLHS